MTAARAAALLMLALVAAGCSGGASSLPKHPVPPPDAFVVTYFPGFGNIGVAPAPTTRRVRCGVLNLQLCASIAYYVTHPPRQCRSPQWTTPASLAVAGWLHGHWVQVPAVLPCPPPAAIAEADERVQLALGAQPILRIAPPLHRSPVTHGRPLAMTVWVGSRLRSVDAAR